MNQRSFERPSPRNLLRATLLSGFIWLSGLDLLAEKAQLHQPWPMHHVCRDFLIANSLNAADVDGDGFNDYSVIDERRDLITIIFHPGKDSNVRKEWPRMVLGETSNHDGNLPKDKASVFWRENNGEAPAAWKAYPIKWSDGANTHDQWAGEKWDHLIPLDVDGDGDLDCRGASKRRQPG